MNIHFASDGKGRAAATAAAAAANNKTTLTPSKSKTAVLSGDDLSGLSHREVCIFINEKILN